MKTWKTKKTVSRGAKTGKFASKGKCKAFKRQRVKRGGFFDRLFAALVFFALLAAPSMSHAASGGSFVGGTQYIPVTGGSGTSNRFTAPVIINSLVYSNNNASASNRLWYLGGTADGDLELWTQNDDSSFTFRLLQIHRTNGLPTYFELNKPLTIAGGITNTSWTANSILGADANKGAKSVALSGLTFDGTTLTATGGTASNAQPPSTILTNLSGLSDTNLIAFVSQLNAASNALVALLQSGSPILTNLAGLSGTNLIAFVSQLNAASNALVAALQPTNVNLTGLSGLSGTNLIAFVSQLNAASNALVAALQPTNENLTALSGGTLGANSATVTNRFLSGTTNAAPGGTGGTNVVLDVRAANFFVVTATTNLFFTNLVNLTTGYTAVVHILQDATGGRSVTFDTNTWKLGTNAPTFATNANAWQVLTLASCPHGTNVAVAATTRLR